MKVQLPYSKTVFGVPDNIYILGTMNTADRSIALMDTALRRRFQFIEMMPDENVLAGVIVDSIRVEDMLRAMNQRIEVLYDREHMLGHAYFVSLKSNPTLEALSSIFINSIIPLLQEYFYEDYSKIQMALGDNAKEDSLKFIRESDVNVQYVFKGNPEMDLLEKQYTLQRSAFSNPASYREIYE
jgi:5-methylcytosine-specific restriction endonuclease McrBC GTP-binding regulatory subunit McrB